MAVATICLLATARIATASDFESAKLIDVAEPDYPSQRKSESGGVISADSGLVQLRFMVDKQGSPHEIMVIRSSMPKFEEEAIKAVAKYRYQPATKEGIGVDSQMSTSVAFDFSAADLRNARGGKGTLSYKTTRNLPDGYSTFYDQFTDELQKNAPDESTARNLIDRIEPVKHQSFYSLAYLSLARYRLAETFGDFGDQIDAIEELLWIDNHVKPKYQILQGDKKHAIQASMLKLQIESGMYAEAVGHYAGFIKNNRELEKIFGDTIQQINQLAIDDRLVQRPIEINHREYTQLPLLKRSFTIKPKNGQINLLKLRCNTRFEQLEFQPDSQYGIPASWGACNLQIMGEAGTQADLYQQ